MLKERFDWDAELAAPIAHDNAQDDEILQNMITHCRLDHWYNGCWEEVERSISDDKRRRSDTRIELSAEVYGYCREDEDSSRSAVVGPFAAGQVGDDEVAATGVFVDDFDADDESETSASISRDEDEGDGDGDGDGAGGADDDDDDGADTEREDGGGGFRDLSQENGSEDLMVLD